MFFLVKVLTHIFARKYKIEFEIFISQLLVWSWSGAHFWNKNLREF